MQLHNDNIINNNSSADDIQLQSWESNIHKPAIESGNNVK